MAKRTLFYDYKANVDLKLPSNDRLQKRLGEFDTLAEYIECSVLDFEKNANSEMEFSEYVSLKAKEHNVNLKGAVTLDNYKCAMYKSFMVNSHAMLSEFVVNYRNDIRNLIDPSFKLNDDDKISQLQRLLLSLKQIGIDPVFPNWLLPVVNYYRLVRNSVAHVDKDTESCDEAYALINKEELCNDYDIFKDKAPNPHNQITMDDFYFYSACIKHVANYLTMALKGKVDWGNLGSIHPAFIAEKLKTVSDSIKYINGVLGQYNHIPTDDERNIILAIIKQRCEEIKELKRKHK